MNTKKRYLKSLLASSFIFAMSFALVGNVSAYQGTWTSDTRQDLNGISEVGTTYISGSGSSISVTLQNFYKNGKMYGGKTVGCTVDQMVSHKAWGADEFSKYGKVSTPGAAHHSPWFDV